YAQFFAADMTPQGDIFEAQIEQLPLLVPPAFGKETILLAGYGGQAAGTAFLGAGWQARVAGGKIISADAADQGIDEISVDAGMIASLAAHHLASGKISPLTPLYLTDPHLGPKKKASVR
ncbi:MAG: hypothetical protein ACPIB4_08350, partial [Candidatus Puniceispirillaceae bacterium]